MRCSLLIATAALLSLSPDCAAQRRRGPDITRMLQRFDADKDGKLTESELGAQMWRRMGRFDGDDDGVLTKKELESMSSRGRGRGRAGSSDAAWKFLAEKYDANKDGKIEAAEYTRDEATFARLDTNRDGVLTSADWKAGDERERGRGKGAGRAARPAAPKAGQPAPDFELTFVDDEEAKVKLSSFTGERPVALIFGSCT